jgi:hypothetical protein
LILQAPGAHGRHGHSRALESAYITVARDLLAMDPRPCFRGSKGEHGRPSAQRTAIRLLGGGGACRIVAAEIVAVELP